MHVIGSFENFLDGLEGNPWGGIEEIEDLIDALECIEMAEVDFAEDIETAHNALMNCTYSAGCCYLFATSACPSGFACHDPYGGPICD